MRNRFIHFIAFLFCCIANVAFAQNQTETFSQISSNESLPFRISIEQANFQLPVGLHSGMVGTYRGLWIFIAGRMNGLHGFGPDPFPVDQQNTTIYVVDPRTGTARSRSLTEASAGLTQAQIDSLSVVSPQGYQHRNTLYMTGGYGIDTATGQFTTKPILTAIDLPGIVDWVYNGSRRNNGVSRNIRQISNAFFQITGGEMFRIGGLTQLVFGQDFTGVYTPNSDGFYSEQVRVFRIIDDGERLAVRLIGGKPYNRDPNFRRRDLNVNPVIKTDARGRAVYGSVAYAGVFTQPGGVWTVPVVIDAAGNPTMADPNMPDTFKQGMNQYVCATAGLYSPSQRNMFNIFFGGMSVGYYTNGQFVTNDEVPFINQVTTVKLDRNNQFSQFLMGGQYPVILSTQSNPGTTLLFGSGANFLVNERLPQFQHGILNLDRIRRPTVIGHIVGGIQSTMPNTNNRTDSAASPYVFTVTLIPNS